ncbi:MAG TPA: hypothetical protein VGO86_05320 [Candidatus Dormibacteraeota bacterium]|jgi:hypothetical protein
MGFSGPVSHLNGGARYDCILRFIMIKIAGLTVPLRMPEARPWVGDQAVHGDVAFDLQPVGSEA